MESMRVLTLNVWQNAAKVENGIEKLTRQIERSGADVILLQEADGAAQAVAERLGLHWAQRPGQEVAILSRRPFLRSYFLRYAVGVTIATAKGPADFVSVHLPADEYGPYLARFEKRTGAEILAAETRVRLEPMRRDLAALGQILPPGRPVVMGGDLNTPSHLDLANGAASFPVTALIAAAGFEDSYRKLHPDEPGYTWSPVEKWNADYDSPEPQDRIDFIFYRGLPGPKAAGVFVDTLELWPSDHAGVDAEFPIVDAGVS